MIGGKVTVLVGAVCLVVGLLVGSMFGYSFLRPDTNKAVVEQFKKDDKKVEVIKKKEVIRKQENEKVKIIIRTIKDDSGCSDVPNDNLRDVLLDSFRTP